MITYSPVYDALLASKIAAAEEAEHNDEEMLSVIGYISSKVFEPFNLALKASLNTSISPMVEDFFIDGELPIRYIDCGDYGYAYFVALLLHAPDLDNEQMKEALWGESGVISHFSTVDMFVENAVTKAEVKDSEYTYWIFFVNPLKYASEEKAIFVLDEVLKNRDLSSKEVDTAIDVAASTNKTGVSEKLQVSTEIAYQKETPTVEAEKPASEVKANTKEVVKESKKK